MLFTKQKLKEFHHNSQIIPPDYFLIGTHTSEKVIKLLTAIPHIT